EQQLDGGGEAPAAVAGDDDLLVDGDGEREIRVLAVGGGELARVRAGDALDGAAVHEVRDRGVIGRADGAQPGDVAHRAVQVEGGGHQRRHFAAAVVRQAERVAELVQRHQLEVVARALAVEVEAGGVVELVRVVEG